MIKLCYIIICSFFIFSLCSCKLNNNYEKTNEEHMSQNTYENNTIIKKADVDNSKLFSIDNTEEKSNKHNKYKINKMVYDDNDITKNQYVNIEYPKVTNMKDSLVQQQINSDIENAAFEILNDFTSFENMDIEVTYSITKMSSDILSFYFITNSFHHSQAYPLVRISTVNLCIDSSLKMKLNDIINLNNNFINYFTNNLNLCNDNLSDEEKIIINNYVTEMLNIEIFSDSDENLSSPIHCFITEDSLFITIAVPHNLSSYALYELKLSDIQQFLKTPL